MTALSMHQRVTALESQAETTETALKTIRADISAARTVLDAQAAVLARIEARQEELNEGMTALADSVQSLVQILGRFMARYAPQTPVPDGL